MTPKPFNKLAAWVIYKAFIYFSKHVSFQDFQTIWNQAYKAHVEAEWKKMTAMGTPLTPETFSTLINQPQGGLAVGARVQQKGMQQGPTSLRGGLNVGQGGKQPL